MQRILFAVLCSLWGTAPFIDDVAWGQEATGSSARVVCFGDSITKRGYPKELSKLLGVDCINAGVGGNTTAKALRRMQRDVFASNPDLVVILFGTNDSRVDNTNVHVSTEQFSENLHAMIDQCSRHGATAVLCTLPPIDHEPYFTRHDRTRFDAVGGLSSVLDAYRRATVNVAADRKVPLVDLGRLLKHEPQWISADGVHPTPAGNGIIAKLVANTVKPLLSKPAASESKPNFVVIFTDDQGFGDLSCFGAQHVSTPRIDQMAAEGTRLTSFYVAAPVCTPSRAALMTGCYPKRIDMATGSNFGVLLAGDTKGLHPDEVTIAEVLRSAGYRTGMFGKWHLGDQPDFLPTRQGFDEFFGIPYSHDIHPFHPRQKHFQFPPLALLEGETVLEMDPNADLLTKRITERSVAFIEKNKRRPFFLYVPHPIPHRPLHVSSSYMHEVDEAIVNQLKLESDSIDYKTRDKLFRQAIAEIDASVGQILDALKMHGIDENTFVVFTSDNGPAIGSAGPLKGRKGSTFEGGMREATVVRWPGRIPAGKSNDELLTAMDLLPTIANLAGAKVPDDRVIDGRDVWPVLTGDAKSPHEAFFYHRAETLEAVRSGPWKLRVKNGKPIALYKLSDDIGETKNVIKSHPAVAEKLMLQVDAFEQDLALHHRPAAFRNDPKPLRK